MVEGLNPYSGQSEFPKQNFENNPEENSEPEIIIDDEVTVNNNYSLTEGNREKTNGDIVLEKLFRPHLELPEELPNELIELPELTPEQIQEEIEKSIKSEMHMREVFGAPPLTDEELIEKRREVEQKVVQSPQLSPEQIESRRESWQLIRNGYGSIFYPAPIWDDFGEYASKLIKGETAELDGMMGTRADILSHAFATMNTLRRMPMGMPDNAPEETASSETIANWIKEYLNSDLEVVEKEYDSILAAYKHRRDLSESDRSQVSKIKDQIRETLNSRFEDEDERQLAITKAVELAKEASSISGMPFYVYLAFESNGLYSVDDFSSYLSNLQKSVFSDFLDSNEQFAVMDNGALNGTRKDRLGFGIWMLERAGLREKTN